MVLVVGSKNIAYLRDLVNYLLCGSVLFTNTCALTLSYNTYRNSLVTNNRCKVSGILFIPC